MTRLVALITLIGLGCQIFIWVSGADPNYLTRFTAIGATLTVFLLILVLDDYEQGKR